MAVLATMLLQRRDSASVGDDADVAVEAGWCCHGGGRVMLPWLMVSQKQWLLLVRDDVSDEDMARLMWSDMSLASCVFGYRQNRESHTQWNIPLRLPRTMQIAAMLPNYWQDGLLQKCR